MPPASGPTASTSRLVSVTDAVVSRRVLWRAALGTVAATMAMTVSGCGVRLEDDAPDIPLVPTREPIPAEPALLWLLADCRDLAAGGGPHTALYAEQAAVLRSALFRAGIPIETLDDVRAPTRRQTPTDTAFTDDPASTAGTEDPEGPSATSGTVPPPTSEPTVSTAVPTPSPGAGDPRAALTRVDDLAACGPGVFPLIASLLAQRWAATLEEGAQPPTAAAGAEPGALWRFPHLAVGYAMLTQAAIYGAEVVAAQADPQSRPTADATLTTLRALLRHQSVRAGDALPEPVIGYPLPFPVDSPETAQALGTHILTGLAEGYAGLLSTVTGTAQTDSAPDVIAWLGAAAAEGVNWSVPLTAFPGTRSP